MKFERRSVVTGLLALPILLPGCATATQQGPVVRSPSGAKPLAVYGATMTLEIASTFLAFKDRYPNAAGVQLGGVPNLIGTERIADLATNAETQALRQSVKRPDIRIIMTLVEGLYRIVARRSSNIASLADLKGKRIATMRATSADFFLAKMLEKVGLTEADVTVVNMMSLENVAPAIKKGDIDAVAIWEPFSENAVRALGEDAIEFSGEGVYRELFNLNTTAQALADPEKRREIVAFMRAIIAANKRMNLDPTEAQALVAQAGHYTTQEVAQAWKHHVFSAGFADDMIDVLVDEEKWLALRENRQPRARQELQPLIDRSVYEEALMN